MAVTTKRVTREVVLCDNCRNLIEDLSQRTHLTAKTEGFYKKDTFEFDLCTDCGDKLGLKRRGRRPSTETSGTETTTDTTGTVPKRRGRPPKVKAIEATVEEEVSESPPEMVSVAVHSDDW